MGMKSDIIFPSQQPATINQQPSIPHVALQPTKKYLINIVGPTAAGKTALAIKLANHYQTEILSSDSRQFYQEVRIGTAKPSSEELNEVKHHFIDSISVQHKYSAGAFARDAHKLLDELFIRFPVVIMAGGSGLYIKALTEGLDSSPEGNEELRSELKSLYHVHGIDGLIKRLRQNDPDFAEPEIMKNPQRLMRKIEILEQFVAFDEPPIKPSTFSIITIGITYPREVLYQRINQRVDDMMKEGLLEEVKQMIPFKHTYAMQTVGYKELFSYLDGEITLNEAVNLIKQHTRNYAKRQMTWFRKSPGINWFEPNDLEAIISYIDALIVHSSN
jgi:tRNA dimethylallyltransferase